MMTKQRRVARERRGMREDEEETKKMCKIEKGNERG